MNPQNPGTVCRRLINECMDSKLNSCDQNAVCTDLEEGYTCKCKASFIDVSPSPNYPARVCKPLIDECQNQNLNDCDKIALCTDTQSSYTCECPPNSKDIR